MEINELVGKTLVSVKIDVDTVDFTTSNGEEYRMYHSQDCCESVNVEEVIGDIADIMHTPILEAEERTSYNTDSAGDDIGPCGESCTWTFYHIRTIKGDITIRWLGQSNGYYSERVDFEKIN